MADTEVARAVVTIVPSMEGAQKSITEQLTGAASSAGDKAGATAGSAFGGGLSKGLAVAGAAVTAVAGATAAAGTAFMSAAGDVAAYGDNIDKMSQKIGISAEAYQEWDFIAQHSGTSMESLKTSFKTIANAAQDGKEEFKALGISLNDAKKMSTEDLFAATIKGLQNMEEGTQRTAIASALLGKGAIELGALFNTSAADTEAMRQQVHELGGVMSNQAVKDAAAYQDSLQNLQVGFDGLKNNMMSQFLPGITSVMDGLTAIVTGDSEGGLAAIGKGIDEMVSNLADMAPQLFEIGASIIESFAQAILDNLPKILDAGLPIIMELIQGIIDHLPEIFDVAIQILMAIVDGISQNLDTLIPAAVDAILTIVDNLIDNIDLLIDAALALILGLADGLIAAMPQLIERVPEIVIKIVDALVRNAPKILEAGVKLILELADGLFKGLPQLLAKLPELVTKIVDGIVKIVDMMKDAGKQLVAGLWEGFKGNWEKLVENVKKLGKNLVEYVKRLFKIGSPSKLFRDEIGRWIPEGIAVGIDANADSVTDSMNDLMSETMVNPSLSMLSGNTPMLGTGSVINNISSDSGTFDLLARYLPLLASELESGNRIEFDDDNLFKLVRRKNNEFMKMSGGVSAFA